MCPAWRRIGLQKERRTEATTERAMLVRCCQGAVGDGGEGAVAGADTFVAVAVDSLGVVGVGEDWCERGEGG